MDRTEREHFAAWLRMWNDRIVHIDDVALAIEKLIAESANVTFFTEAPAEVQQVVRADLKSFQESGRRLGVVAGTDLELNLSNEMKACSALLQQAGLL